MKFFSASFTVKMQAESAEDITGQASEALKKSGISDGLLVLFAKGSTAAISVMEYEPGLLKDIPRALERIAPTGIDYEHHKTWHDDNGRSHVRATLVGPSLSVPVENSSMTLGTWQQAVLFNFDTSAREREVLVRVLGE